MLGGPELDVDGPLFLAIYREGVEFRWLTNPRGSADPPTHMPMGRYICAVNASLGTIVYADVDITGLTIAVDASPTPRPQILPGGPDKFAGDPRLDRCEPIDEIEYVFEVPRGRDVHAYIPGIAGIEPELQIDTPVLFAIYREAWMPAVRGGPGPSGAPPYSMPPGTRAICAVGVRAGSIDWVVYGGVDITGLTIAVDDPAPTNP
jgi:hypothetical protein